MRDNGDTVTTDILERVQLGTDLEVSRLALGTYKLADKSCAAEALALLGHAYDSYGITFFDTSDNYTGGELLLGTALRDGTLPRDDVVIATKTGLAGSEYEAKEFIAAGRDYDTRPERIRRKVEGSLRVLGVDTIDLYQVHVRDPQVSAGEVVATMAELTDEGKIRHWGISNYNTVEGITEIMDAALDQGVEDPLTLQDYYNMFGRQCQDAIGMAHELGMTVLAFSPLAKGLISEAVIDEIEPFQRAVAGLTLKISLTPQEKKDLEYARNELSRRQLLMPLHDFAADHGQNLQRLGISWLLRQEDTIPLLGAYRQDHLDDLVQAATWQLDEEGQVLVERTISSIFGKS